MTQYAFFFNQKRCLGCKTCVIACKEWNESKRGDANLNRALTEATAGTFDTPASWGAGARADTLNGAHSKDILRRFDAKENWRRVTFFEFGTKAPNIAIVPLSIGCNHCSEPACIPVCPVKAISKEAKYGAVRVDSSKCISCGACRAACPWDAPQYYKDLQAEGPRPPMTKCDLCYDRLEKGLKPACVASCPGRALELLPVEEILKLHPNATRTALGFKQEDVDRTKPNIYFESRELFL